ncbi:MAG TPA: hypothetical protein VGK02_10025, partial [Candidatus Aquicultor sp.]
MPDSKQLDTDVAQPTQPSGPANKRRTTLWIAVTAVIILFLAIPYWYTSNPQSCTRCHDMQKYYDSWKISSHSTAANNCFVC